LATSGQPAINALVNPSNVGPEKIGPEWWNTMTNRTKAESVINLIASFWVNYPTNKKFIQDAWAKLKENTKDMFKSPKQFIDNLFSIVLGLDSGLAAGALTLGAFTWIVWGGLALPSMISGLSFLIASTSRYIGLKRAFKILENLFSHEAKVQKQAIDALHHLQLEKQLSLSVKQLFQLDMENSALANIERSIKDILQAFIDAEANKTLMSKDTLNDQDYEDLFKKLVLALGTLESLHPDNIYHEKCTSEYIAEYSGVLVRLGFAIAFGLSTGCIFLQKGYDAVNLISKLVSGNDLDQSDMHIWLKRAIGLPAGLGSGTLYAVSASEFPKLFFIALPTYLWNHPKHIVSALFLLTTNYFASSSMHSVASGVLNRENNILGILPENPLKDILPYVVRTGSGFVNILSELKKYNEDIIDPNHPTLEELVHHFEDPNTHRIQPLTAADCSVALNRSSYFYDPSHPRPSDEENPGPQQKHDGLRHSNFNYAAI
jgi:hypothetical protein